MSDRRKFFRELLIDYHHEITGLDVQSSWEEVKKTTEQYAKRAEEYVEDELADEVSEYRW